MQFFFTSFLTIAKLTLNGDGQIPIGTYWFQINTVSLMLTQLT